MWEKGDKERDFVGRLLQVEPGGWVGLLILVARYLLLRRSLKLLGMMSRALALRVGMMIFPGEYKGI